MGYLSQKKKQKNINELLNISLAGLSVCCLFILFSKETTVATKIMPWLFHLYIYTIIMIVYACAVKFYKQTMGLLLCLIVFFFNISMGSNLFFDVKTDGVQSLSILFQSNTQNASDSIKQIENENLDIAAILSTSPSEFKALKLPITDNLLKSKDNIIISKHKFSRSGEVLLSKHGRAAFADINVNLMKITFIALDFSKLTSSEQKMALRNLTEFVNMQDVPVIIVGDFGQESWSTTFLKFLEDTKLEVKNSIILSNGDIFFNPLKVPSLNVLAYKDFGITSRRFLSAKRNPSHPLLIKLNY